MTVVVDVTNADGKVVPDVQQKYQMRTDGEGEWYITARLL